MKNILAKQDIQELKQDIEGENTISNRTLGLSLRTKQNIEKLYNVIGSDNIFGRSEIMEVLGITPSPASELIKKMLVSGIIEPVIIIGTFLLSTEVPNGHGRTKVQ